MDGEGYASLEALEEYERVVNQTFRREEDCYDFYNSYAASKDFSIRKELVRRDTDTNDVIWRKYTCSHEGYRAPKHFGKPFKKREPRGLTRCGCPAKLEVQLYAQSQMDYDAFGDVVVFDSTYRVNRSGCLKLFWRPCGRNIRSRNAVEHHGRALVKVPFTEPDEDIFVQRAARIFTPPMFYKVRVQIQRMAAFEIKQVVWEDDDCMRCRMMECEGILCAHLFCVMRANMALFKASRSVEATQRVMQFIDEIMGDNTDDNVSTEGMSFAPLPALFSSAHWPSSSTVLNPNKIVGKGAPTNK
ncbi:hypothetical protein QOZ80_6AG0506990 [Eleusine coracana subsp. coracana]|nr:hypothetical protein QOZ80_6AG0506990 [Eleusine coracana subsp. coracana]